MFHGTIDELVPFKDSKRYVVEQCAEGANIVSLSSFSFSFESFICWLVTPIDLSSLLSLAFPTLPTRRTYRWSTFRNRSSHLFLELCFRGQGPFCQVWSQSSHLTFFVRSRSQGIDRRRYRQDADQSQQHQVTFRWYHSLLRVLHSLVLLHSLCFSPFLSTLSFCPFWFAYSWILYPHLPIRISISFLFDRRI